MNPGEENKNQTGLKFFKWKPNLNHNIHNQKGTTTLHLSLALLNVAFDSKSILTVATTTQNRKKMLQPKYLTAGTGFQYFFSAFVCRNLKYG